MCCALISFHSCYHGVIELFIGKQSAGINVDIKKTQKNIHKKAVATVCFYLTIPNSSTTSFLLIQMNHGLHFASVKEREIVINLSLCVWNDVAPNLQSII